MSTGKIVLASLLAFIVVIGMSIAWVVSVKFQAGTFENQITASNQSMQNVHSSVNKILKSSGITVKNFGETKIKVIEARIKMYADKPDMMMMWVKENPENIDSKMWERFQDQIETQYTKFEMEQKDKISKSQAYKDFLDNTVRGQVAQVVWSYPKPETLKIMNQVIKTEETAETFETGIDKEVDVFSEGK
jgi:hypothetical protein